jgi:hypothetical protein
LAGPRAVFGCVAGVAWRPPVAFWLRGKGSWRRGGDEFYGRPLPRQGRLRRRLRRSRFARPLTREPPPPWIRPSRAGWRLPSPCSPPPAATPSGPLAPSPSAVCRCCSAGACGRSAAVNRSSALARSPSAVCRAALLAADHPGFPPRVCWAVLFAAPADHLGALCGVLFGGLPGCLAGACGRSAVAPRG